jgi:5-methylcytosine-specific restriction enzyme subunit McrC
LKPVVTLREWSVADPESHATLAGLSFDQDAPARALAERLARLGAVTVTEIRQGLRIESESFVGSVTLGPIQLRIQPKIRGAPLLTLVRYAYGLRSLELLPAGEAAIGSCGFEDLLLFQLAAEVRQLVARGLHRAYVTRDGWLALPRGRLDFGRLARTGGLTQAALPCRDHRRLADCVPNQVVLAGLRYGIRTTHDDDLRAHLRHLAKILEEDVAPVRLDRATWVRLRRTMSRLTRDYEAATRLVALLTAEQGATIEPEAAESLPGFLFDMNRFFEALISRFLREHLPEAEVREQARLHDVFEYDPEFNPRGRQAPRPRPDLIVREPDRAPQLLDTKYRDLWELGLPREMLYQLSVYTLSHAAGGAATILYPTTGPAREARIVVRDPATSRRRGVVALRPVQLDELSELLGPRPTLGAMHRRLALARELVYGVLPQRLGQGRAS